MKHVADLPEDINDSDFKLQNNYITPTRLPVFQDFKPYESQSSGALNTDIKSFFHGQCGANRDV